MLEISYMFIMLKNLTSNQDALPNWSGLIRVFLFSHPLHVWPWHIFIISRKDMTNHKILSKRNDNYM